MMDEFDLDDLDDLAEHIIDRSRQAMLRIIGELPHGTWHSTMRIDGVDEPLDLVAAMTVSATGIDVDFAGTSPQAPVGINVPMAYTDAYTSFGVRCIVGPSVPNNSGSPRGHSGDRPGWLDSELHRIRPPVNVRHVVGQMLPDTVFGCLSQILPDLVPAEGTSSLWNILIDGQAADGERYVVMSFHSGGAGARPGADGLSATAFPSGVAQTCRSRSTRRSAAIVFWRKEFRPDSGGDGKYRGGHGPGGRDRQPRRHAVLDQRRPMSEPCTQPEGRAGGGAGALGELRL